MYLNIPSASIIQLGILSNTLSFDAEFINFNLTQFISEKHFHFDKRKNFYCLRKNLNVSFNGCLGKNKGRKRHVYLSEFVKNNLKSFFHKWNLMFYELINKKFNW